MTAGLVCEGVDFVRRGRGGAEEAILVGIEARFPAGAVSVITGATGAGKSTLLHLLAGLMRPTRGRILADGEPVSRWITPHLDRWRRRVGIVFQEGGLFDDLTVLENVLVPLVPRGGSVETMRAESLHWLRWMDVDPLAAEPAGSLSGGQRQRVAAARALALRPEILLADEPTAHQDETGARRIIDALRHAEARGATVVAAAHDPRLCGPDAETLRWRLTDGRLSEIP